MATPVRRSRLMGRKPRLKPERLAVKLRAIREGLGLSQGAIVKRLNAENLIDAKHISKFELGEREPSLVILLRYARLAGVSIDVLADDDLDLPAKLPSKPKHT
jgi:transcriptional regulator with XRE-family HTH domain